MKILREQSETAKIKLFKLFISSVYLYNNLCYSLSSCYLY